MKKIFSFAIIIILLKVTFAANDINLRKNQEGDLYDFLNISNIKCNETNYVTSFLMKICGKTEIKSTQNYSFSFPDTKKVNHTVKCSVIINNKKRALESIENRYIENDNSDIDNTDYETIDNYDSVISLSDNVIPDINNINLDSLATDNYDLDTNYINKIEEENNNYESDNEVTDYYYSDTIHIHSNNKKTYNLNYDKNYNNSDLNKTDDFYSDIKEEDSDSNIEESDVNINNSNIIYSDKEIRVNYTYIEKIDNNESNIENLSDIPKEIDNMTNFNKEINNKTEIQYDSEPDLEITDKTGNFSDIFTEKMLINETDKVYLSNETQIKIVDNNTIEDLEADSSIESNFIIDRDITNGTEIKNNITQIETTTEIKKNEITIPKTEIESTIYKNDIETVIPTNELETTDTETKIPSNEIKTINSNTDIETVIPTTELEVTDIETKNLSIKNEIIDSTMEKETSIFKTDTATQIPITDRVAQFHITDKETSIPTEIEKIIIEKTQIIYPSKSSNYNFCYDAICTFNGMIREDFEVKIEDEFPIYIEEFAEDIFIQPLLYDLLTYKVSKCYLIKNIFKQVLKFKIHSTEKKISFNFISIILKKVEKGEELTVNILLKRRNKNLRNLENLDQKVALCKSNYNVEPVEGKEIDNIYSCEVINIENPNEYSGLVFSSSSDVQQIPNDTNSTDPAITDKYIKEGKIQDYSLLLFEPKILYINNCYQTSRFTLFGNLNKQIDDNLYFGLYMFLDNEKNSTANCSLVKGLSGEVNMTCNVLNYFYNSSINIPEHIINDINSDEPLLNITEFNYAKKTTCEYINPETTSINFETEITETTAIINEATNKPIITTDIPETTKIPNIISSDIIFRQISHLEINSLGKKIKFNLIGFTFNTLERDSYMLIPMNLIKSNNNKNVEINATCTINNDTNGNINKLAPLTFNCEINDVNDVNQITDVKIISSSLIKNIPIGYSNIVYAKKTDDLINQGKLLDYLEEDNLNKIPPLLSNTLINTNNCRNEGTFDIQAYLDSSIEKNISFYLQLKNPNIDVRCKIPESAAYTTITIKCNTMSNFNQEIIEIESKIVYDMDYNELFYINNTQSYGNVNCKNNMEIKKEEATKKLNAVFSFRQVSKFGKTSNKYHFFLATFIKENISSDTKLSLKVKIKSEGTQSKKVDKFNKRKLSPIEEQTAECSISLKTEVGENGVGAAGWGCETGESSIDDAIGLDIIGSDDISGIPDDPSLVDPAKTDELIENGEITDYSIEENLSELLPIFNTLALNYSLCRNNGSFYFEGNVSSSISKDVIFNLSIVYPETVFACRLPRTLKGQVTQIECFNRDNFENSSILVEETVIRDGFNEFFILRNISSGDLYVTCSSTERQVNEVIYDGGFNVITRNVKSESSGGIGTAGLIIIISVGLIVFLGIISLLIFLKKKNKKKILQDNDKRKVNSSGSSFGSSSSSSYY